MHSDKTDRLVVGKKCELGNVKLDLHCSANYENPSNEWPDYPAVQKDEIGF